MVIKEHLHNTEYALVNKIQFSMHQMRQTSRASLHLIFPGQMTRATSKCVHILAKFMQDLACVSPPSLYSWQLEGSDYFTGYTVYYILYIFQFILYCTVYIVQNTCTGHYVVCHIHCAVYLPSEHSTVHCIVYIYTLFCAVYMTSI